MAVVNFIRSSRPLSSFAGHLVYFKIFRLQILEMDYHARVMEL